jgi:hypothetical protein
MTLRLILALSLALVPVAASAAPAAAKTAAKQPRSNEPAPLVLEYENDTVGGESLRPEGADVGSRTPGRRESLIHVRTHFIPQMLKMAIDV